uniref:Uncharacterized protein n=1 Tax=Cryptomonas curvata TaxID=233186 RepID=A0A7S0ME37_9CRYP|mmetsp:Transcript_36808/g.76870  ORF Transcript_36808/g.76870 Transcript_36808/m.76870 type:complete len:639 (+) Transcript_36808:3-1919(+)
MLQVTCFQDMTFNLQVGSLELFENHPIIYPNGTMLVIASRHIAGRSTLHATARDSENNTAQAYSELFVRAVNTAPNFKLTQPTLTIRAHACANDEEEIGYYNTLMKGSCHYVFPGLIKEVQAGNGYESCKNCHSQDPLECESTPFLCQNQSISFSIDSISDPRVFRQLPVLSVDGLLTFSLEPGATGKLVLGFKADDDGGRNLHAIPLGKTECSIFSNEICGPGVRAAQTLSELGENSSPVTDLLIEIDPMNYPPTFGLTRRVSCLDRLKDDECTCPSETSLLRSSPQCTTITSRGLDFASVEVLEGSPNTTIAYFATDISTSSEVMGGMAMFSVDEGGNLTFLGQGKDAVIGRPGLELVSALVASPDQRFVYTAEHLSSTITVLNATDIKNQTFSFLDRRANGENRIRFMDEGLYLETQNPCGSVLFGVQQSSFFGIAQGCIDLKEDTEFLPSAFSGDAASVQNTKYVFGYLWKDTVAYWDFSSEWAKGNYSRSRINPSFCRTVEARFPVQFNGLNFECFCDEKYDVYMNPAGFMDIAENFPLATLHGMNIVYSGANKPSACRSVVLTGGTREDTFLDAPIGQQVTALTYLLNNGNKEALQFDDVMNSGMWVSNDIDDILDKFPSREMSLEIVFFLR